MEVLNLPQKLIPFDSANYPGLSESSLWVYSYAMVAVHDKPQFYRLDGKLWAVFDYSKIQDNGEVKELALRGLLREFRGYRLVFIGDLSINTGILFNSPAKELE